MHDLQIKVILVDDKGSDFTGTSRQIAPEIDLLVSSLSPMNTSSSAAQKTMLGQAKPRPEDMLISPTASCISYVAHECVSGRADISHVTGQTLVIVASARQFRSEGNDNLEAGGGAARFNAPSVLGGVFCSPSETK